MLSSVGEVGLGWRVGDVEGEVAEGPRVELGLEVGEVDALRVEVGEEGRGVEERGGVRPVGLRTIPGAGEVEGGEREGEVDEVVLVAEGGEGLGGGGREGGGVEVDSSLRDGSDETERRSMPVSDVVCEGIDDLSV